VAGLAVLDDQGAVGPEGDDHGPGGQPAGQGHRRRDRLGHRLAGQLGQLDPVGHQHVDLIEEPVG
jgi:hypothetical protein